jgi:hypothetical protein
VNERTRTQGIRIAFAMIDEEAMVISGESKR